MLSKIFRLTEQLDNFSSLQINKKTSLSFVSSLVEIEKFFDDEIWMLTYKPNLSSKYLYASIIFLTKGCLITSDDEKLVKPIPSVSFRISIASDNPDLIFFGKSIWVRS